MRYTDRDLAKVLLKASRSFPAVVLTGPRGAGKTVLLRKLFYFFLSAESAQAQDRPRARLSGLAQQQRLRRFDHVLRSNVFDVRSQRGRILPQRAEPIDD